MTIKEKLNVVLIFRQPLENSNVINTKTTCERDERRTREHCKRLHQRQTKCPRKAIQNVLR